MLKRLNDERRLPRHYWPIVIVALFLVITVTGGLGALIGVNPYIAGSLGGGLYTLRETWIVRQEELR